MRLRFSRTNGPVDEAIDRLIEQVGPVHDADLVREMILAALKAGQEEGQRGDLRLMNISLKEMRFTTKAFGPYRHIRKVTVFGSARTHSDEPIYRMARLFGQRLASAGYMVITGGGGGIMQAANEGAGFEHSFGVNIQLPFEQKPNPVLEGNPRLINYHYFFNRKVAFLKQAHAVALFPGGFGTLDEAMETLTLVQTGKRPPLPLVLLDEPGGSYWKRWIQFFQEELLAEGYIVDSDFSLFTRVDSVDEAIHVIDRFYRRYHSLRWVDGKLVLRLTSAMEQDAVRDIEERFRHLLTPQGGVTLSCALAAEANEPDIADLPRLVVDFNRKDFGGLRRLIDAVNEA